MAVTPVRFLIDESSLRDPIDDLEETFERALTRIRAGRIGGVGKLSLIWEEVIQGHTLSEWLFNKQLGLDPVVADAMRIALDRCLDWDEVLDTRNLPLDVTINGKNASAWSVGAAASFSERGVSMGCIPLSGPLGTKEVATRTVSPQKPVTLSYVGDEASILTFLREIPEVEDLNEAGFFANAKQAFPNLRFFRERTRFDAFDEEYRSIRRKVTHHLSVLSDHAADIFKRRREPKDVQGELSALGVDASGESSNTKANARAMRQRKIMFEGREVVLDWHTKIRPHLDRIYFSATARPHVVVGVFHRHLD